MHYPGELDAVTALSMSRYGKKVTQLTEDQANELIGLVDGKVA